MKSMKVRIGLLVMLALVLTTSSFAFWASGVTGPADDTTVGTVTVGTGNAVTTSFTLGDVNATGGDLVPAAQLSNSAAGAVDSVNLQYSVLWAEDAGGQLTGTTSTAALTVTPVVTILDDDGSTPVTDPAILALITVTPAGGNASSLTLGAPSVTLSFVVTMAEPADQVEYDLIASGTITVTFTWSLGTVNTVDNG